MAGRRRNVNIGANSIVYSGRGRPRTKEAVDRPLPVGIILGSPSPGGDMFKNRKIRVGGPFQAKVPKQPSMNLAVDSSTVNIDVTSTSISSAYRSSRAPPFRVSMAHPHLTQDQVNQYEREQRVHQEENDDRSSKQEIEGKGEMIDWLLSWCGWTSAFVMKICGCQVADAVYSRRLRYLIFGMERGKAINPGFWLGGATHSFVGKTPLLVKSFGS